MSILGSNRAAAGPRPPTIHLQASKPENGLLDRGEGSLLEQRRPWRFNCSRRGSFEEEGETAQVQHRPKQAIIVEELDKKAEELINNDHFDAVKIKEMVEAAKSRMEAVREKCVLACLNN